MIDDLTLLRGEPYYINNNIFIKNPTLNEVYEYGEQNFYGLINRLASIPSDYKSELFDIGIDYEKMTDFELFILQTKQLSIEESRILFGERLDFTQLLDFVNPQTDEIVLAESEFSLNNPDEIVIDSNIYMMISDYLCKMNGIEKKPEFGGNEIAKRMLIEIDREDKLLFRNKPFKSILKPSIIAMVNSTDFKYNFETVWDLSISIFFESARQIQKLKNVESLMFGAYSGNIDTSKISPKEFNWI